MVLVCPLPFVRTKMAADEFCAIAGPEFAFECFKGFE